MRTNLPAPILVLLPLDWRRHSAFADSIDWHRAGIISGLVQTILMVGGYIAWYFYSVDHWVRQAIHASLVTHPDLHADTGVTGSLTFFLIALHPLTWILWYLAIEGILRTLNARANFETPGTLPLRLLDRVIRYAKYGEWKARHRVKDEVMLGEGRSDLKISSSQPKSHWKYPLTIRYQNEFYQVQTEQYVAAANDRPYVYLLRRLPANEIIRGLESYDPDAAYAEQNPPGFFATIYSEARKKFAR
ncbi:MAG TPA: hypothetical protein VGR81_10215 [Candidatus Acidoferrales bacterium]|nr:hypothetical protein [Candidatus Acidoferrales bacterium]